MAKKITKKERKQLETWIGQGPKTFQLLYSIQRDGCSPEMFHQRCDNQGCTVTVVYNTSNSVYGGYTTKSWTATNTYVADDRAFLFQLRCNDIEKFNLFPVHPSYTTNAICPHSNYGPTFGGGHTVHLFNGIVSKSGSHYSLNGYTKFTSGYYSCSISDSEITNGNMNVFDLEIYRVIDGPDSTDIDGPWRKAPPLKKEHLQQLMEKIENYCPPSALRVSYAKILMIGPVGAGKSSFFNTINSIFKGRITYQGCSGSAEHSLTSVYRQYQVKSLKTGKDLKFRLCDTCGLEESLGPDVADLNFLITGNIPDRYQSSEMAKKITKKEEKQLETWIGQGPKTFQLLYSSQRDGCSAGTFHQRCDNQGSRVTVVYNTSSSVYGGFTTKTWASTNNYVTDDRAFLFQLRINGIERFNLFPVTPVYIINAIFAHSNYGPTFGGGHTLHTFTGTVSNTGSGFFLNGYTKFQAGYYSCSLADSDITNGHLNVFDIEVYKVTDEPDPIERPWRMAPPLKREYLQQLMEKIEKYCPPSVLPVSYAKILMIGPVGAGKSSFFNTINSIFKDRITYQASSGNAEHSLTTVYTQYPVRSMKTGLELKFRLCDTCGLEESFGPDLADLHFLISGNIPEKYQFNPSSPVSSDIPGFIYKPELNDKVHCVVFVLDGSMVDDFPQSILVKLNQVQRRMNLINLPRVVLLTKIDKLSKTVQQDVSKVFESGKVKEAVDKASEIIGVPRSNVLPIKNYENEIRLDDSTSCLALLALDQIIGFAEDFLANQRVVVQS